MRVIRNRVKIDPTKVLKYNFAEIVAGILPKNNFYGILEAI